MGQRRGDVAPQRKRIAIEDDSTELLVPLLLRDDLFQQLSTLGVHPVLVPGESDTDTAGEFFNPNNRAETIRIASCVLDLSIII